MFHVRQLFCAHDFITYFRCFISQCTAFIHIPVGDLIGIDPIQKVISMVWLRNGPNIS